MKYDQQAICDLLNTLQRYEDERYDGVCEDKFGDYVKLEDVAALFNLQANTWRSDEPVTKKILPND